jgi:hypothetical protein
MSDPIWKLYRRLGQDEADAVWREWPDGRQESCLVTTEEYVKWIEAGNEPLPPDALAVDEPPDALAVDEPPVDEVIE